MRGQLDDETPMRGVNQDGSEVDNNKTATHDDVMEHLRLMPIAEATIWVARLFRKARRPYREIATILGKSQRTLRRHLRKQSNGEEMEHEGSSDDAAG